jgi:hypothetical protein
MRAAFSGQFRSSHFLGLVVRVLRFERFFLRMKRSKTIQKTFGWYEKRVTHVRLDHLCALKVLSSTEVLSIQVFEILRRISVLHRNVIY